MNAATRIEPQAFRETLSCFPTGVAIVTTHTPEGVPIGMTISSFNSVSMSPPLVLWSLSLHAMSLPIFRNSPGFAINVLAADQIELAKIFGSRAEDRFDHGTWERSANNGLALEHAAAVIVCKSYAHYDGGDHEIIVGEVTDHSASDRVPLVFGKGRLAPLLSDF